jgi:hypothetical protein
MGLIKLLTEVSRVKTIKYMSDSVTIGDTFDEDEIYSYTQRIHHTSDDFIDGDLGKRIEKYKKYIVKEIDISKIDIDEFNIDQGLVEDYEELIQKNNGVYPPVILSKRYRIIDGTHRLNALTNLKYKTVIAFIGA